MNYFMMKSEILLPISAWEKTECLVEVTNNSQRIFTLVKNNVFLGFPYIYEITHKNIEEIIILN